MNDSSKLFQTNSSNFKKWQTLSGLIYTLAIKVQVERGILKKGDLNFVRCGWVSRNLA